MNIVQSYQKRRIKKTHKMEDIFEKVKDGNFSPDIRNSSNISELWRSSLLHGISIGKDSKFKSLPLTDENPKCLASSQSKTKHILRVKDRITFLPLCQFEYSSRRHCISLSHVLPVPTWGYLSNKHKVLCHSIWFCCWLLPNPLSRFPMVKY